MSAEHVAVPIREWLPDPIKPEKAEHKDATHPDLLPMLFNDHGNACRLIELSGEDLKYCHAMKKWLVWDGKRWAVDETDQARRRAKQTMLEFLRQGIEAKNEAAEKFARGSLDARRVTSMLSMAECEIYVKPAELDTNPYLLNFLNGSVDLRSGELRPHDRANFITKLVRHEYLPGARCPRWLAFLSQLMGGGPDASEDDLERAERMVEYMQRAFGYSLTGCTIEKAIFMLVGEKGDNGKTTMVTTYRQLIDEYSALIQVESLMVKGESNNSQADLADLRGARFAQTSETEEGQRIAQGKLKRITQGMGKIKAVRKYENPIEFPETHKLWIDTNRKPEINDDKATFNRLHLILFPITIPKDQIDRGLPAKLLLEAEGILAWAVEGAMRWHESGLNRPPEVKQAGDQWRSDVDQIGRFLDERCITADGLSVGASQLYAEYKFWAEVAREKDIMSATVFGSKLANRDGISGKHGNKGKIYNGIGLRCSPKDEE